MADIIYFNIEPGHFKVWGFDVFKGENGYPSTVITYWGRIGVPMERLPKNKKEFLTYREAYDYAWSKIFEKQAKGYYPMPNWQYFGAIYEEKPIGQLAGLMEAIRREHLEKSR